MEGRERGGGRRRMRRRRRRKGGGEEEGTARRRSSEKRGSRLCVLSVYFSRTPCHAACGAGGGCVCADCRLEVLGGLAMEDVFFQYY